MNWHEPLISPATAFYCFLGFLAMDGLYFIVRKVMKEGRKPEHEPLADAPGDWPHDGRRGNG